MTQPQDPADSGPLPRGNTPDPDLPPSGSREPNLSQPSGDASDPSPAEPRRDPVDSPDPVTPPPDFSAPNPSPGTSVPPPPSGSTADPGPGTSAPPPGAMPPPPTASPESYGYQSAPPPASYGYQQRAQQLSQQEERTWGMVAHLSALIGLIIGLSFLGPLIVMLTQGTKSAFVRDQSVEALNFNITVLIAVIISTLLIFVVIGLVLLPVILIAWLVFTIIGAITANDGRPYRYPINIRMVK